MKLHVEDIAGFKRWAFFSLTDKSIAVPSAQVLQSFGFGIMSAGGTCKLLDEAGLPVLDLAELVGGGAILGHTVLTISRELAAGELASIFDPSKLDELKKLGLPFIDLVYCNLYKLLEAILKADKDPNPLAAVERVIQATDIGGPNMLRAAAKGFRIVVNRKCDMEMVLKEIAETGDVCYATRQELRGRAEFEVHKYTGQSAVYHGRGKYLSITGEKARDLAYGENRDQSPASLYACDDNDQLALHRFNVLTGDPSYISMADGDRALGVMCAMAEAFRVNCDGKVPFISVACKHGNPCGIGVNFDRPEGSLKSAMLGDPVAVMGAEFMTNFPITAELGKIIYEIPDSEQQTIGRKYWGVDVLYAPSVDDATVELLGKKERRRILVNPALSDPKLPPYEWMHREVRGGFLRQKNYHYVLNLKDLAKITGDVSQRIVDIIIAWAATWRSVSNTVAIAKNGMLQALGDGQQDRMACVQLCIDRGVRAHHDTNGSTLASDGFFPYAKRSSETASLEGPELLVQAGCKAVVVPYDGKNVAEVEEFFRQAGVFVVFVKPEHRGFFAH